jgi:hypothetical protein
MLGRDRSDPLFLQVKEAGPCVLADFARVSEYASHGQRVVAGQRLMQAASDILLGRHRSRLEPGSTPHDFYIRQLRDWKASADIATMTPAAMRAYGQLCGWTLARAPPVRGSDRHCRPPWPLRGLRPGDRGVRRGLRRPERARLRPPRRRCGQDRARASRARHPRPAPGHCRERQLRSRQCSRGSHHQVPEARTSASLSRFRRRPGCAGAGWLLSSPGAWVQGTWMTLGKRHRRPWRGRWRLAAGQVLRAAGSGLLC